MGNAFCSPMNSAHHQLFITFESNGYLQTVANSGITPFIHFLNSLNIARKSIRGKVLAEPSPWTVAQGVTRLLR